ncbi:MAG: lasso peptide biosynthesis PqqD family chaperone [bacterium]|nr:lasso peptide biosynthesis PqqD family chaperone [bacterium]
MDEKPTVSVDSIIAQSKELMVSGLDGDTVMMDIERGGYFGLNKIGSRVWELIEEPRSVSAVCDTLIEEFEVEREQCEQEVISFVTWLVRRKLAELVSQGG